MIVAFVMRSKNLLVQEKRRSQKGGPPQFLPPVSKTIPLPPFGLDEGAIFQLQGLGAKDRRCYEWNLEFPNNHFLDAGSALSLSAIFILLQNSKARYLSI